MTSSVTRSLEIRDHFVTIQQITKAPDMASEAYFMPRMLAGAAGFEPATLGFGDRCSSQTELRSCVSHAMTCWHRRLATVDR